MIGYRINFLGLPLDAGLGVTDICNRIPAKGAPLTVTFINPAAWALAEKNTSYLECLKEASIVLPDGEGVARVCRWLTKLPCPRISFDMSSLADPFFKRAAQEKLSIVLIGSAPGVTKQVKDKLEQNYPGLIILNAFDGYGDKEAQVKEIGALDPDIVIIGMGAPHQEAFLLSLSLKGFKGFAITCGGFFDQYLQATNYYPAWIDRLNLRFAYRLFKEPLRLWRRYLIDYQLFIKKALTALIMRAF